MNYIQSLIFSLVSDVLYSIAYPAFYSSVISLKVKRWQYILIMASLFILLSPLQYIFPIPHPVVFVAGVMINIGGIIVFGKNKFLQKVVYGLIPYVLDMICSIIYIIVRSVLMPEWQLTFGNTMFSDILDFIIVFMQTIVTMLVASKIIRRKKPTINDMTAVCLLVMIILQIFMLTFIMYIYCRKVSYAVFDTMLVLYLLVSAALTTAVIRYNAYINKKLIKQDMIEEQYQFMNTQYEQLRNSYISYKKLRHDIKDHLNVVDSLAMSGKIEELHSYTNTLTQSWESLSSKTFCDVPAVDIVIAEKYNLAVDCGIKTDFTVSGIKATNADTVYLSSIFSNLLNNALEASSHCKNGPYINLHCGIMMENLVINCRNSMPDYEYEKSDAQSHGYGLKIINDCAKLLDGTFFYEHDDSTFTAIVTIPINKGGTAK